VPGSTEELLMQRTARLIAAGAIGAAALAATAGAAIAAGSEDGNEGPDTPITGAALDKASTAALTETGGGKVTGTEVGDEESYYEVEVTLDDGTQVDVQLDKAFGVVSTKADHEDAADSGEG
jgi:uncharacterized membrane protein YkoI